jgi:hypothetical protein
MRRPSFVIETLDCVPVRATPGRGVTVCVNECKGSSERRGNPRQVGRIEDKVLRGASNRYYLGESLSIQFATRLTKNCVLAVLLSLMSFAQTAPSSTPPSSAQPSASHPSAAQDSPSAAQSQPVQSDKSKSGQDAKAKADAAQSGTSKDRLFYALPNFLTLENGANVPPLTAKQKFAVVARGTFDPVQFPWWGLLAAISQAENSEPGYGQGWAGYGKRYGATAADSTIENFMVGAVFASALHQDPRFFQSSTGGFFHRTGYAVSRIVVTRGDSGHSQFNASEIIGSATAAAISTYTYHPRSTFISTPTNPHLFIASDRTLTNAADVWVTQMSLDAITIVVKEFWPDIHRKMSHKPKQGAANSAP